MPLLSLKNVSVSYRRSDGLFRRGAAVRAVDDISFDIMPGETLGLVGESGCGKSTLARAIMRLQPVAAGSITFDGEDITSMPESSMRLRRKHLQMIFQDSYASLDPRMSAEDMIGEPIGAFGIGGERRKLVADLLTKVGLDPSYGRRRARQFSGGQRQRISIARALAAGPRLIVADEPVSALDVSIQAQILNLLKRLQRDDGVAYLFISHDLRAVRFMADKIAVMLGGRIVEYGSADEIVNAPQHEFTRSLLAAMPGN